MTDSINEDIERKRELEQKKLEDGNKIHNDMMHI